MIRIRERFSNDILNEFSSKAINYTIGKFKRERASLSTLEDKYSLWRFASNSNISRLATLDPSLLENEIEKINRLYPEVAEYYDVKRYFSPAIALKVNKLSIDGQVDKQIFDENCNILLSVVSSLRNNFTCLSLINHIIEEVQHVVDELSALPLTEARTSYKDRIGTLYGLMSGKNIDDFFPPWIPLIGKVFNYKGFVDQSFAIRITNDLAIKVCPYCNIEGIKPDDYENKNGQRVYRPPLDHYFPKSIYPFLSISIYNLVPCCSKCNTTYKLDYDTYHNKYKNPYLSGFCSNIFFEIENHEELLVELEYGRIDEGEINVRCTIDEYLGETKDIFRIRTRYTEDDTWLDRAKQVLDSFSYSGNGTTFVIGTKTVNQDEYISYLTELDLRKSALERAGKKYKIDLVNQVYGSEYKV